MTPIPPPHLTDGRILLRQPTDADVDAVAEACQDTDIQAWTMVPSPYTREDAEGFVAMSRARIADGTGAHLLVVDAETGALLGACGVSVNPLDLAGEVGYWTAAPARGRGVASGALRLLCRWAFDELGLRRLHLRAAADNAGSNAVARRVGFVHEGVLRQGSIRGHTGRAEDPRVDMNLYGLLPGELR